MTSLVLKIGNVVSKLNLKMQCIKYKTEVSKNCK